MRRLLPLLLLLRARSVPRSRPLKADGDVAEVLEEAEPGRQRKNYFNSTPELLHSVPVVRHDPRDPSCNVNFKLKWSTHVGSSVISTPIVYPNTAGNEHKKQIFLNTYFQYIELLDDEGNKPWGWPLNFESSSFASTPLLYDIDGDGTLDVGVVDRDANMYWIQVESLIRYYWVICLRWENSGSTMRTITFKYRD